MFVAADDPTSLGSHFAKVSPLVLSYIRITSGYYLVMFLVLNNWCHVDDKFFSRGFRCCFRTEGGKKGHIEAFSECSAIFAKQTTELVIRNLSLASSRFFSSRKDGRVTFS